MSANHASVELTRKEISILKRVCEGKTYRQIADIMKISPRTVEWHVNNALKKTQSHNRIEAVQVARKIGALPYPKPTEKSEQEVYNSEGFYHSASITSIKVTKMNIILIVILCLIFCSFMFKLV